MANTTDTLRQTVAHVPPSLRVHGASGIGKTTLTVREPACRIDTAETARTVSDGRRTA